MDWKEWRFYGSGASLTWDDGKDQPWLVAAFISNLKIMSERV